MDAVALRQAISTLEGGDQGLGCDSGRSRSSDAAHKPDGGAGQRVHRRRGLSYLVLGARITLYHEHADLDVEEYVRKRNQNGERCDPELCL